MKLISCYVENFGGLHQFSMDFTQGLNVVHEENGWGKSTLSVFLKSMFFGMEYSPKKKLASNERRKYQPWQGGNYGGNVIFSHGEKTYKIERFFGAKDKEDTFALYDMGTGLESRDFSENIGEEIFEVDRDSFAMSVYFPQNELPVSMSDSLNAKINDLDAFGGDIDRYDSAMQLLDEHLKEYKKTGNRGLLGEWENRIAQLNAAAEDGNQAEQELEQRREQLARIKENIRNREEGLAELHRQEKALEEQKTLAASQGHLQHLAQQLSRDQERMKPLKDFFKGGIPTEEDIEQLIQLEEKKKKLETFPSQQLLDQSKEEFSADAALLEELKKAFGENIPDAESFTELTTIAETMKLSERRMQKKLGAYTEARKKQQQMQRENSEQQQKREKKSRGILLVGFVLVVLLIVLGILLAPFRIPCIALGAALCLLLGGYKMGLIGKNEDEESYDMEDEANGLQKELEQLQESWEEQKKELALALQPYCEKQEEDTLHQYEDLRLTYARYQEQAKRTKNSELKYKRLLQAEQEFKIYRDRELKLAQSEKQRFSEKYGMNLSFWNMRMLMEIRERKHEYENLRGEYAEHKKQLEEFQREHPQVEEKGNPEGLSQEQLTREIARLEQERQQLITTRESYRRDMELLTTRVEEAEGFRRESLELQETYEEGKRKADLLQKTMKYLKEAKETFSTRYMDKMREGFHRYMSYIDPGAADRMHLDASLRVKEESGGSLHEDTYLSTGMGEFAGICTRLALVEAMYETEKPFLILDDPFVNLDEEKVQKGMELLRELSLTYQILYFTCHESRA